MTDVSEVVASHLLDERSATIRAVVACADTVADDWDGGATTDRDLVVPPFETTLREAGLPSALADALAGAVDASGAELRAPPVPASPYVVVASTGPVLRATLPEGRLVVRLDVFAVERDGGVRYVRTGSEPRDVLDATLR
ncbi:hypothetical protein [Halegenticoccus tardaugens]|uniref:hypothetical protein n=1 Tax=Halegenticoccus tardaugens TaxID=2071624 RepID=UPI00100A4419|nr:hypothetical protein [Halegenticoccus tardaugens]